MLRKKLFVSFLSIMVLSASVDGWAQNSADGGKKSLEGARPDIPGQLGIEFGFIQVPDFPEEMKTKFLGTNVFSGYYKYGFNLGQSNFSVHPGLAITAEQYSFNDNITIISQGTGTGYETTLIGLDSIIDGSIKKSQLKTSYLEIPLELTYRTNHDFPKRSFKVSLGVKGGILIDSNTKFKYDQDGENKITKQKERYDLNRFRAIAAGRVGYGNIGVFFNYNILPLFEVEKGPLGTEARQISFGISLDLF